MLDHPLPAPGRASVSVDPQAAGAVRPGPRGPPVAAGRPREFRFGVECGGGRGLSARASSIPCTRLEHPSCPLSHRGSRPDCRRALAPDRGRTHLEPSPRLSKNHQPDRPHGPLEPASAPAGDSAASVGRGAAKRRCGGRDHPGEQGNDDPSGLSVPRRSDDGLHSWSW